MSLREEIAGELLKIPKGYVGITDPIEPVERDRRLKRTRVQATTVITLIIEKVKGIEEPDWRASGYGAGLAPRGWGLAIQVIIKELEK